MRYEPKLTRGDKIYLCGAEGCGKGYTAKKICKPDTRLAVFDAPADWEHARVKIHGDIRKLIEALKRPVFRVAFIPDMSRLKDQFDAFNNVIFAIGRMRVVYDELNLVTMPGYTPPSFLNITSRSRHRGLHVIGMSQRPGETGKSLISNATQIYAGRLAEPSDIAPLRARAGREFAEKLPGLPLRHMEHWRAGE